VISRIIKVKVSRVISRSWTPRLITLTETLTILDITKTESNNCFIIHWTKQKKTHVCASSLTASKTKQANLAWLPLQIMHHRHTWHDYPWPWHDYLWPWHDYCTICSYDVTGTDFENSLYTFGQWSFIVNYSECRVLSIISMIGFKNKFFKLKKMLSILLHCICDILQTKKLPWY